MESRHPGQDGTGQDRSCLPTTEVEPRCYRKRKKKQKNYKAGFLVPFIEEKKRREKIDSPPRFFPEWFQSCPGGSGSGPCSVPGSGRGPGSWKGVGGLAASQGIGVSKNRSQAGGPQAVLCSGG